MEILDRPVTKDDILKLARFDTVVNKVVIMYEKHLMTWEEAMMTAVHFLSQNRFELIEESSPSEGL